MSRYQKGKTNLDFTEARNSVCRWHLAPCFRQIITPAPHHSVFTGRMPFLPPKQRHQSTEGSVFFKSYDVDGDTGAMFSCLEPGFWPLVCGRSLTSSGWPGSCRVVRSTPTCSRCSCTCWSASADLWCSSLLLSDAAPPSAATDRALCLYVPPFTNRDANPPAFGEIFPLLRHDPAAFPGRKYILPHFTIYAVVIVVYYTSMAAQAIG